MCAGMVIEGLHEGKRRPFVSKVTSMLKEKHLCSEERGIINKTSDYFAWCEEFAFCWH